MPPPDHVIEVRALRKAYGMRGGVQVVLDGVGLGVRRGEAFGLAGPSGAGKSTLGRIILGLVPPTSGEVLFEGRPVLGPGGVAGRAVRRQMQMVFQNPLASMNPRRTASSTIEMPLEAFGIGGAAERRERVGELLDELLDLVGLNPRHAEYYPHEFSAAPYLRLFWPAPAFLRHFRCVDVGETDHDTCNLECVTVVPDRRSSPPAPTTW